MKKLLSVSLIAVAIVSCNQVARQVDEARKAKKKRDSILKEFKAVNDRLDSLNKVYEAERDSIQIKLNDTSLSR